MAAIEGLINKVIQAMKDFIEGIQNEGKRIINVLATYSSKVATEISSVMSQVFTDIKRKISMIIRAFKSKIDSFSRRIKKPHINGGTTITTQIKNATRDASRKVETMATKFGKIMESLLTEMREAMSKIANGIKTGAVDALSTARRIGTTVVVEMEKIGKTAIESSTNAVENLSKDLELGGEFIYKHGIQVASTAAIAIINPYLVGSAVVSAGLIIGAVKYEPT